MGAIALASNPIYHARTKHVEVDYHFIREKVLHKDIAISYLSTHDQLADIFTKGLTSTRFLLLRDKLMIVALPISLRGAVKTVDKSALHDSADHNLHDFAEHALLGLTWPFLAQHYKSYHTRTYHAEHYPKDCAMKINWS
jgi:hypothetical protein